MQVLTQTDEGFDNIAQTNIESQKQQIFAGKSEVRSLHCEVRRLHRFGFRLTESPNLQGTSH